MNETKRRSTGFLRPRRAAFFPIHSAPRVAAFTVEAREVWFRSARIVGFLEAWMRYRK